MDFSMPRPSAMEKMTTLFSEVGRGGRRGTVYEDEGEGDGDVDPG